MSGAKTDFENITQDSPHSQLTGIGPEIIRSSGQIKGSNLYEKLMNVRVELLGIAIEKTGHNKFAGFKYFELGDFLPHAQKLFLKHRLCGFVSFGAEEAKLEIIDIDAHDSRIVIASPMSSASLKGVHEIQNLGAVQTYMRRYLWLTALELVEHDSIDGSEPVKPSEKQSERPASQQKSAPPQTPELNEEKLRAIGILVDDAVDYIQNQNSPSLALTIVKQANLSRPEFVYFWKCLGAYPEVQEAYKKAKEELEKK
jgi:hypothetical protein